MRIPTILCCLILSLISCNLNKGSKKIDTKTSKPQADSVSEKKQDLSDMVYFEGGSLQMGSEKGLPQERPIHPVTVKSFYLDKSPVTVAQFGKFVIATGYKTDAEKFGDSGVFNFSIRNWQLVPGAYWKYPFGKNSPQASENHPVTQVSWNDAIAYASWTGKRLPTEAEWEYAARCGGKNNFRFSWGDQLVIEGKYKANVWQGKDLSSPEAKDDFLYTSPVGYYGETLCGLTDMGGNVWNWCSDVYAPYPGNKDSFQPNDQMRVIRGGSFFFDQNGENSFSATGRSFNSFETSLFNTGFRCARDRQ